MLTNVTKVRIFMGLVAYCKIFIHSFLKLVNAITSLLEKNKILKWNEKYEKEFTLLNEKLTITSILTILDLHGDFIIDTDASLEGSGSVLS